MQTKFVIRNDKEVAAFLKTLPRGTIRTALKAMADYFIGDERHGLRHNEPYKYVSRAKAGYKTSAAQIRFMFATGIIENDGKGGIKLNKYKRTKATSAAWTAKETGGGYGYTLQNPTRGAYFTRSDKGQARQPALVGWRKVSKVVKDNMKGAMRSAMAKVKEWIRANKPKGR